MTFSTIRVSLNRRLILIVSKLFSVSSESTSRDKNSHVVAPRVELNRIKCVNRSMSGNKMRQKFYALRKKLRKILLDYDKRRRRRSSNTMCLARYRCLDNVLLLLSSPQTNYDNVLTISWPCYRAMLSYWHSSQFSSFSLHSVSETLAVVEMIRKKIW